MTLAIFLGVLTDTETVHWYFYMISLFGQMFAMEPAEVRNTIHTSSIGNVQA